MSSSAENQIKALRARIQRVYEYTEMMMGGDGNENKSADKIFISFLLVGLAKEHGLLDDNCNRAVITAMHVIGLEERSIPLYLEKKL